MMSCIIHPRYIRADAAPHFDRPYITVRIEYRTSKLRRASNVLILIPREGTMVFDTPIIGRGRGGQYLAIYPRNMDSSIFIITGRDVEYQNFRLLLLMGSDTMMSPILHALYRQSTFDLTVTDSGVIDSSTIFQMDWSTYLSFLLLTVLSECIFGLMFFKIDGVPYKKIWVIAAMNLISHPVLWTLCTLVLGFGWGKVIAEIGVVFFEGWWIYKYLGEYYTFRMALRTSWVLNFISYFLGGILSLFIGIG